MPKLCTLLPVLMRMEPRRPKKMPTAVRHAAPAGAVGIMVGILEDVGTGEIVGSGVGVGA